MELKTFSESEFDPKKWINKAWSSCGSQEKEIFVANTVTRLQLYMKQLTNSLDETTTQIVTSIPRILQDASSLQVEGALLQQRLLALESKVQGVEEQTGHSIESLQRIDHLKSRLENAASALREADKWAALATSLEDILDAGIPTEKEKLDELSDQVAALTASLEVLSDAADYEHKQLQLETLYNRLEAAASSPLIDALTKMDADRTATYVRLFTSMSRCVSARRCWRRAAAARLEAAWRGREHHTLGDLNELLAGHAVTQVEWLTNVLKSDTPIAELMRLYTDLLLSLEPSPTKIVTASLKLCSSPEDGIVLLTNLRTDIDEFVACIRRIVDAPNQVKETIPVSTERELGRAAYCPLRELLPHYSELQTQLLLARDTANLKQDDLLEQSRELLSICERSEGWIEAAYNTAKKIAGDAAYPFYAPAVDTFMTSISTSISAHTRSIEAAFAASLCAGQPSGVLSVTFPASLVLEAAAAHMLRVADGSRRLAEEDAVTKDCPPLLDLPSLLLDPETRQGLPALRAEPPACAAALRRSRDALRGLARAILRNPVDVQLEKIPDLPVWSNNDSLSSDLPEFALSPQEYITEVGQYLMTLPQHLEVHLGDTWHFLAEVCTHTCEVYAEKILNIKNMDALGTKRCLTDIVYLSSVVEDLGSSVTPALRNLEKSLRAAAPATD